MSFGLNGVDVDNSTSLSECGFCSTCGKNSNCKCDRCGDFYCSVECQLKDWPSHRFICFPMPKLVKVVESSVVKNNVPKLVEKANSPKSVNSPKNDNSQINTGLLPDGCCVILTAFKSLNRCFIRSANPSITMEYQKVLNEINDYGRQAPEFTGRHQHISTAFALKDEKWCRVKILGCKNKSYSVVFVDFGDKGERQLKELRKISPNVNKLPCYIQSVQLKGITNTSSNAKLMNSLKPFLNMEYKIKYSNSDKSGGTVELLKWGSSTSLNSLVQQLYDKYDDNDIDNKSAASSSSNVDVNKCEDQETTLEQKNNGTRKSGLKHGDKATPQSTKGLEKNVGNALESVRPQSNKSSSVPRQIQMQKPCLIPPFEFVTLTENDGGSQMLIMDNSFLETGFIGCLLEKYCENLKTVTEFLSKYNVGDQPYKPMHNEYCLAQFDNMWYRAKVAEILPDDKFLVVYIDFTNEKELSSNHIRRYPLSLDYDCCTTLCCIDGLPDEISAELKECLEKMLNPFSVLKVDSIRKEENIIYIKSMELLKKLCDLKLI